MTGTTGRAGLPGLLLAAAVLAAVPGCASGPGPAGASPAPGSAPVEIAAPPTSPAPAPPGPLTVDGESVSFELEAATERALQANQIDWGSQEPSKGHLPGHSDGSDTVITRIEEGTVDLTPGRVGGRVRTVGLIQIVHAGMRIEMHDPLVDLDRRIVEATVDGRRTPVLDLDLSRAHREDRPGALPAAVDISGTLSDPVRRLISERLGTTLSDESSRVDVELSLHPSS